MMLQNMRNGEYIESFVGIMKEDYKYSKLKQMPANRLDGLEYKLENRFMFFKTSFPPKESKMQGEIRKAFGLDDTKEALTPEEILYLENTKDELKHNIYRARGYREDEIRKHRRKMTRHITDSIRATSRTILEILRRFR